MGTPNEPHGHVLTPHDLLNLAAEPSEPLSPVRKGKSDPGCCLRGTVVWSMNRRAPNGAGDGVFPRPLKRSKEDTLKHHVALLEGRAHTASGREVYALCRAALEEHWDELKKRLQDRLAESPGGVCGHVLGMVLDFLVEKNYINQLGDFVGAGLVSWDTVVGLAVRQNKGFVVRRAFERAAEEIDLERVLAASVLCASSPVIVAMLVDRTQGELDPFLYENAAKEGRADILTVLLQRPGPVGAAHELAAEYGRAKCGILLRAGAARHARACDSGLRRDSRLELGLTVHVLPIEEVML